MVVWRGKRQVVTIVDGKQYSSNGDGRISFDFHIDRIIGATSIFSCPTRFS
jgi:hypothetical protein